MPPVVQGHVADLAADGVDETAAQSVGQKARYEEIFVGPFPDLPLVTMEPVDLGLGLVDLGLVSLFLIRACVLRAVALLRFLRPQDYPLALGAGEEAFFRPLLPIVAWFVRLDSGAAGHDNHNQ